MAEFKDRLEQALNAKDMKPVDLARLTGIGEGAISQYRKGAYKPAQRNLEKISKVLDVSIPWLMGADEMMEPVDFRVDGLREKDIRILRWFRSLPPDKRKAILALGDAPTDISD